MGDLLSLPSPFFVIPGLTRDPASSFFNTAEKSGIPDRVRDDVEHGHHG
ncbi:MULTISPECIES: hypothetical protein [unclassified Sphingomonas]|nr:MULTISPECIES: hypothetical protein [unclassified Sphingomonas]